MTKYKSSRRRGFVLLFYIARETCLQKWLLLRNFPERAPGRCLPLKCVRTPAAMPSEIKGSGGKEEKRRFFVHRSLTRFLITPGFSSSCFWRGVVGSCCLGDSSTVFARVQYSAFVQDEYEGCAEASWKQVESSAANLPKTCVTCQQAKVYS